MTTSSVLMLLNGTALFSMIVLAYVDGMLVPSQMRLRHLMGFPLVANGGIWGSLLIMPIVLYIAGQYADGWSSSQITTALFAGLLVSYLMHRFVYLKGKYPDALAGSGQSISPAGCVHLIYLACLLAIIALFYLCSRPTVNEIVAMGILLLLFSTIANHLPLVFVQAAYRFPWCPDMLDEESNPLRVMSVSVAGIMLITAIKLVLALRLVP